MLGVHVRYCIRRKYTRTLAKYNKFCGFKVCVHVMCVYNHFTHTDSLCLPVIHSLSPSLFLCPPSPHLPLPPGSQDVNEQNRWVSVIRKACLTNREMSPVYHPGAYKDKKWTCCRVTISMGKTLLVIATVYIHVHSQIGLACVNCSSQIMLLSKAVL